jgi:hypothetical protein
MPKVWDSTLDPPVSFPVSTPLYLFGNYTWVTDALAYSLTEPRQLLLAAARAEGF